MTSGIIRRLRRRVHLARLRLAVPLKLEIGGGPDRIPGFVRIDRPEMNGDEPVLPHALPAPLPFAEASVNELRASLPWGEGGPVWGGAALAELWRLLRPGGQLLARVAVPAADARVEPSRIGRELDAALAAAGFVEVCRERDHPAGSPEEVRATARRPAGAPSRTPSAGPCDRLWAALGRLGSWRHLGGGAATQIAAAARYPLLGLARRAGARRRGRDGSLRVIAVSLGGRGDLISGLVALSALSRSRRPVELTLVVDSTAADVRQWCPAVTEVIGRRLGVSIRRVASGHGGGWSIFRRHPGLYWRLAGRGFDLGVILGPSPDAARFAARLLALFRPSEVVGLIPAAIAGVDRGIVRDPLRPLADQMREAVALAVAGEPDPSRLFPGSPSVASSANRLLAEAGLARGDPYLVINPGARRYVNERRWPAEMFAAVADRVAGELGLPVVIVGGWEDEAAARCLAAAMEQPALVTAGRARFAVSAWIIRNSRACLTNDTAALHVALVPGGPRVYALCGPSDPSQLVSRIDFAESATQTISVLAAGGGGGAPPVVARDLVDAVGRRCVVFQSRRGCVPCETTRTASDAAPCPVDPSFACLADLSVEAVWRRLRADLAPPGAGPRSGTEP